MVIKQLRTHDLEKVYPKSLGSATQVISLMVGLQLFFSNEKILMPSFSLERLTFIRVCFLHIQDFTENSNGESAVFMFMFLCKNFVPNTRNTEFHYQTGRYFSGNNAL